MRSGETDSDQPQRAPLQDGPAPLNIHLEPIYQVGKPDPHGGLYQIAQFLHVRFEDLKRANPWLARQNWNLFGGEILTISPSVSTPGRTGGSGTTPNRVPPSSTSSQGQTSGPGVQPQQPDQDTSTPDQGTNNPPSPPVIRSWLAGGGQVLQLEGLDLIVLGGQATFLRQIYDNLLDWTLKTAMKKLMDGESERVVAQWCVWQRNSIKQFVRESGSEIFKTIVEMRNKVWYGNPLGPSYSDLKLKLLLKNVPEAEIDGKIIRGSRKSSKFFDNLGPKMKKLGVAMEGAALVVTAATVDSPESLDPLPASPEEEIEKEEARVRYGIPATANIDRHGHLKPGFYLQLDIEDPHVDREFEAETDEILWYLGVDITYNYNGHKWTVPGKGTDIDQDLLRKTIEEQDRQSPPPVRYPLEDYYRAG